MGKRSRMFRCQDCGTDWWEWFDWMERGELLDFALELTCPECESENWKMTDASSFSGSRVYGDAAVPRMLAGISTVREFKQALDIPQLEERIADLEGGDDE